MKSLVNRIFIALIITAITGVLAFARAKKEIVTFPTNINVNGTLVKKGTYEVSFNQESGDFTIAKNGKVVATAQGRVEKREVKARSFEIRSTGDGDATRLVGVAFTGSNETVVVNNDGQTAANE